MSPTFARLTVKISVMSRDTVWRDGVIHFELRLWKMLSNSGSSTIEKGHARCEVFTMATSKAMHEKGIKAILDYSQRYLITGGIRAQRHTKTSSGIHNYYRTARTIIRRGIG